MTRIFISHSHADEAIAYELVDFLIEALGLNSKEILCTSNPDQGLSYSPSSIADQLKEALKNSEALIILITSDSLHSAWIPFEAGSFWTTDKPVIPILGPGLTQKDLPGPLKNFLTISIEVQNVEDKVNSATNQLAEELNLQQAFTKRRSIKLQEFLDSLKAWQPKTPITHDLKQENEQLKAQIQEQERSHNQQIEESETKSRKQKQELEQQYQNQKEQLKKSLQLQITQLEQQLANLRALQSQRPTIDRSQQQEIEQLKAQIQEQERSHQQQIKEIETKSKQEKQELERRLRRQPGNLKLSRRQFLQWAGLGSAGLVIAVLASKIFKEQPISKDSTQITPELPESSTPQPETKPEPKPKPTNTPISESELDTFEFETVKLDQNGDIVDYPKKQAKFFKEDLGNGVNLDMVFIPGGKFMMGSPEGEGKDNERPQHEVTVKPFYMGKYPITQVQYLEVMGKNPSRFEGDERPVENISWNDAVDFCQKISEKTGKRYVLPSEAEWEYACRAGTSTPYYFGKTITYRQANFGNYISKTTYVGQYLPNSFGLYDMHANVWEWCEDNWHDNYEGAPNNGIAWVSGESSKKVIRGGSWNNNPDVCRSALRLSYPRVDRDDIIGFRVVCVAPRTT